MNVLWGFLKGIAVQIVLFFIACVALVAYLLWSIRTPFYHGVNVSNQSSRAVEVLGIEGISDSGFGPINPGGSARRSIGLGALKGGYVDLRLRRSDGTTFTYRVEGWFDDDTRVGCKYDCIHRFTIRDDK